LVDEGKADGSIPAGCVTRETAIELNALADGLSSLVDTGVVGDEEAAERVRVAVAALARGART
ncbi:MAG: hypothetical protein ACRC50_12415, partial [Gaiella sp.]